MRNLLSIVLALALGGCFATVGPDGQAVSGEAEFRLNLPVVLPPLVVIEPGVSVVSSVDDEVFYSDGYYWARSGPGWYRSRDHRAGWSRVEPQHVPAPIARSAPGRYRNYRASSGEQGDHGGRHDEGRH